MGVLIYISGEAREHHALRLSTGRQASADLVTGAVGVLAAVAPRPPTAGPGRGIDLSLTEVYLSCSSSPSSTNSWAPYQRSGQCQPVLRTGRGLPHCRRQWVSLSGRTNAMFANNCRAIGRPER